MADIDANLEAESWKFLSKITDDVKVMDSSVQQQIIQYGRALSSAGAVYIHVIDAAKLVKTQALSKNQAQIEGQSQSQSQK
jgi:hypothetical protein